MELIRRKMTERLTRDKGPTQKPNDDSDLCEGPQLGRYSDVAVDPQD